MGVKEIMGNEKTVSAKGISVIIPVYNAQNYITRCIESILNQGTVILEIICVDDGSTDESSAIIERYIEKDARIRLIRTAHNGVSHARNVGKRIAKGEYIMFADADDYLLPNKLRIVYQKANKSGADIVVFGACAEDVWHAPEWVHLATNTRNRTFVEGEAEKMFSERGVLPVTWNKLYRKQCIELLEFPESLFLAEDNVFQFWAFLSAKKVKIIARKVYVYCINETSVMSSIGEEKKHEQHNEAIQYVKKKLEQGGVLEQYLEVFNVWKRTVDGSETKVYNKKLVVVANYVKKYGLRSAIQKGIGKYFITTRKW